MKPIEVVCGIIFRDNKILIARRKKGKAMEGKWEFPGGKVEDNETLETALKRELKEEFGMVFKNNGKLGQSVFKYPQVKVKLTAFKCEFVNASFILTDHDDFKWVNPKELQNYDLAEADIPLLNYI
jgi:8-oxo-dGTP diphosphatase